MEPEWTWPYFQENYTGPYLSDGRFQSSVAYGRAKPKSKLDRLSRKHDTAYALARSDSEKRTADREYYDDTRSMSWFPRMAGNLVLYGNDPTLIWKGLGAKMGNSRSKNDQRLRTVAGHDIGGVNTKVGGGRYVRDGVVGGSPVYNPHMPAAPAVNRPSAPSAIYGANGFRSDVAGEYTSGGGVNFYSAGRKRRRRAYNW